MSKHNLSVTNVKRHVSDVKIYAIESARIREAFSHAVWVAVLVQHPDLGLQEAVA